MTQMLPTHTPLIINIIFIIFIINIIYLLFNDYNYYYCSNVRVNCTMEFVKYIEHEFCKLCENRYVIIVNKIK